MDEIYEVWHEQSGEIFLVGNPRHMAGAFPPFPGEGYRHVANVRADELEAACALTNSIDWHWSMNLAVEYLLTEPTRSTCVGDVVVNRDAQKAWRVADIGFSIPWRI